MRKFFPSLNKYNKLIFAENAGGTQVPEQVIETFTKFVTNNYVQPNSNNYLSKKMTKELEEIKNVTNIFFNNKDGILVYENSCSQLAYNLANSLKDYLFKDKYNEIILSDFSHESCITPFERIAKENNAIINWWKFENNHLDYNNLIKQISPHTRIVVLPHVSNILGNVIDIEYLSKKIKEKNPNTLILVDGVAYLPHDIIDINSYNIDYYIVSFYKFCGLRVSVLWNNKDSFNLIKNQNHYFFDSSNFSNKLEIGGANYECLSSIKGLSKYLVDYSKIINYQNYSFNRNLLEIIFTNIKNYEKQLEESFRNCIEYNDEIEIIEDKNLRKIPIFSLRFKNYDLNNITLILNELGIICKNGTFYCNRLFENLKININQGTLRISLMHYNTFEEIQTITNYLNLFKKKDINFDFAKYYLKGNDLYFKSSFQTLPTDKYYNNKRNRAFSMLKIDKNIIQIVGNLKFYQSEIYNNFNGNKLRDYDNINENLLYDNLFHDMIKTFMNKVNEEFKEYNNLLQIHQIRVYANQSEIDLVPEGIHQDGFNMIGICCVNRSNIDGGISNIYNNEKDIIYSDELKENEMIIINDRKLFHDVSAIKLKNNNLEGYRDVFVLTTIS